MKLIYPEINEVFDTEKDYVNTIIIEKTSLLTEFCTDIYNQFQGLDGKIVISDKDKPLDISKYSELLMQFIPFELNRKSLISKLVSNAEHIASDPEYYESTMQELANLEKYLWNITECMDGNISFPKLNISSIIKASGIEFEDDYTSLGEKIVDYMELVRCYDKNKLFIFVNLRSYVDNHEFDGLLDTILRKHFDVIMIDNCEKAMSTYEKRYIIDAEGCEIA